ncbi:MAG: hypothetical protein HQM09_14795 [Candidatus Riflebacteria bacterium]|nr:hypothetical protein [Candidatus Riflebacteria bacterium]
MNTFIAGQHYFENNLKRIMEGGKECEVSFDRLCALTRINILAGLCSAEHGWLGASFSCVELLAAIFTRYVKTPLISLDKRDSLVISKGHAVLTQYALLSGMGAFPVERMQDYKSLNGLPGHCDRSVPGVDTDSGSLGLGLSKGIGISLMHHANGTSHRCFVLIGDGELQEGQLFEAFLTLKRHGLTGCIPIIDRNGLQSDSATADIKDSDDWAAVFRGIGLDVISFDGHRCSEIFSALDAAYNATRPTVLIANTIKGGGSSYTAMSRATARRKGIWHGRIPDGGEYLEITGELVKGAGNSALMADFKAWKENSKNDIRKRAHSRDTSREMHVPGESRHDHQKEANIAAPTAQTVVPNSERSDISATVVISTGEGFTRALESLVNRFPGFVVLNADLEKSCRLSGFAAANPGRFFEVGISEQDMASIANGIGLAGGVGIVNTYASFYKRCVDQVFSCAAEGVPAIFAGHYAGLDYFTDGKSHQSLNDVAIMRAVPGLDVFEPLSPDDADVLLETLLERMFFDLKAGRRSRPAYVRLHRTPASYPAFMPEPIGQGGPRIFPARSPKMDKSRGMICAVSPHGLEIALDGQQRLAAEGFDMDVAGFSAYVAPPDSFIRQLECSSIVVSIESHLTTGGLADILGASCARPILRMGAKELSGSVRTLADSYSRHGFNVGTLCAIVREKVG